MGPELRDPAAGEDALTLCSHLSFLVQICENILRQNKQEPLGLKREANA